MPGPIVVVGSLNQDVIIRVPRLPSPGETVVGCDAHLAEGGKGGNQAVAAARLGARVQMVGRVGQDPFGKGLVSSLASFGVDTGMVEVSDRPTGTAAILVGERGQNLIAVSPGANDTLDAQGVFRAAEAIRGAGLLVLQCEIPASGISEAVRIAAESGVPVLLNAAPADRCPPEVLPGLYCLVVNEIEAAQLTGIAVADAPSATLAVETLLRRGPARVVVTLGAMGAVGGDASGIVQAAAASVHAVDATGAGDAFVAALAVAALSDIPLPGALRFGCLVGALAVTKVGARASLPSMEEVERFAHRLLGDSEGGHLVGKVE